MPQPEKEGAATRTGRVLFVYYKVAEADRSRSLQIVRGFEKRIAEQFPLLSLELMQRPAASAGMETWMEIFRDPAGLTEKTLRAIEELAGGCGMPQPRFSEVFVPLRRDDLAAG